MPYTLSGAGNTTMGMTNEVFAIKELTFLGMGGRR